MENWQPAEKERCPYYIVGCKWGRVLGDNGLPIVNKCALSLGKMYPTPYSSRHLYGQWWGLNSNWGKVYQTVWRLVIHSWQVNIGFELFIQTHFNNRTMMKLFSSHYYCFVAVMMMTYKPGNSRELCIYRSFHHVTWENVFCYCFFFTMVCYHSLINSVSVCCNYVWILLF